MKLPDLLILVGIGILLSMAFVFLKTKAGRLNRSNWMGWGTGAVAILLVGFSLAWAYASLMEDEIQAAYMGLFVFGGPGIVAAIGAWRLIKSAAR
ncbi:MAG: hypothetical protein JRH15_21165 [Deltaproteobacteria bacterium]|nr:hypothetical protein [Deltaproteobacteria bacterium]